MAERPERERTEEATERLRQALRDEPEPRTGEAEEEEEPELLRGDSEEHEEAV